MGIYSIRTIKNELATPNLAAVMDLPDAWPDQVHGRTLPDGIILDMDSSESPTHGQQEDSA